ncbi:MAG: acrylyl-CoA reductase (NADPH) [Gammaproteobacteria bacterium]|jgi:acrylyl-CoA reductase (NADPH)
MTTFKACRVHEQDGATAGRIESISLDDLTPGGVVIKAAYSDINYKDALAITGAGRIMRNLPRVAGIDVSGTVHSSNDDRYAVGDEVLVTGCNIGEIYDGGFAEYVRVAADSVIPLPEGLSLRDAMAIGTAGFTAALAVHRMQQNSQTPEMGPIAITGPTGGVGGFAINMLSNLGFETAAITGKPDQADYLKSIGASQIIDRNKIEISKRPLDKALWAGAVDSLGGEVLSWLTRTTGEWGNVAVVGLAASHKLETSVMPLILRGVNLLGINSVATPCNLRLRVWERLASDLKPTCFEQMIQREISLDQLTEITPKYISGEITGRTLVKIA